ncbi:kinase-like protein [Agrocybe pediades]|nr:kinase-like protein [Agrocybe pediades]
MEAEAAAVVAAALGAPSTVTTTTRPTIIISEDQLAIPDSHPTGSLTSVTSASPLSPLHPQYRGWLSFAVQPLSSFIDSSIADPRLHYLDLREIAEGESGSVYAARVNMEPESYNLIRGRLQPSVQERDEKDLRDSPEGEVWVAIKSVAIVPLPSASAGLSAVAPSQAATISVTKLRDLKHELTLLRDLSTHDNILGMDAVYVDLLEDSLWVRMELMERSLADIIALAGDGLQLQERVLARFTSDILSALDYLQKHNIAHRDVRSDNLLLNKHGVLKLAEFSNAVQVSRESPMRDDVVGVVYWQAPEVRRAPYNALKVDVWSLGATVWEMAQQDPPFSDTMGPKTVGPNGLTGERWPPLRQPELYSPAFHDFLRRCSEHATVRPDPAELLKSSFIINKACGRHVIVLLLTQCMTIEKLLQEGSTDP